MQLVLVELQDRMERGEPDASDVPPYTILGTELPVSFAPAVLRGGESTYPLALDELRTRDGVT